MPEENASERLSLSQLEEIAGRHSITRDAFSDNPWFCVVLSPEERDALVGEVRALRQALWDAYGILGFDQDGDATPDAVVDLVSTVVEAARDATADYQSASDAEFAAREQVAALQAALEWACEHLDRLRGDSLTLLNARGRARLEDARALARGES